MSDAFICDAVRTPIGRYGGSLAKVRADDLGAVPISALNARNPGLDFRAIDEVFYGCANQAGEDNRNVARMSLLLAGLPVEVPGVTFNRLCASGLEAVGAAARAIRTGEMDMAIAGGVESMTRAPLVMGKSDAAFGRNQKLEDTTMGWRFINPAFDAAYGTETMPRTGENVAEDFGVSRADQDAFALRSQQRAAAAEARGFFAEEIVAVEVPGKRRGETMSFSTDEHPRADTTLETLQGLKPLFGPQGTVTAGNASGINDGATAMIVATEKAAKDHGLVPRARILGMASAGVEPRVMGIGPLPATRKLIERLSLSIGDFDVIELNEAFASQALAVLRGLGLPDDAEHVNANGGAIALGHPLGMSGARIAMTAVHQLERTGAGEPAMAVPQIRNAGPGYEWKAVALLSLAFGLVGLDRWIIAPLAPAIIADLGISPPLINALIAILGVTWGIAAVAMGSLSDRIGRRKVMLPAILIFSIASGLSGLAAGFTSLLLIRGFMGIAEGAFCPTSFASTAEASNPSRIGFNQGLQQSMFALFGLGFGPILATWLLGFTSWRGVFAIVMLPGVILTVLLWMVIREPDTITDKRQATTKASVSEVLKVRNVQISMVGLLCAMCGIFVLSANTPIYLASYLKLTPIQVGLVTSAIGFGGFVGQWVLPALSDIFGRRPMAVLGFVGGAAFVYLFMNIGAQPMQLFGALFAATVFSFGLLSLLTGPVAAESAPAGMVSTAAGLIIGVGEIFGGGLALLVAGYVIATYGIQYMLYLALGGLVVGAFLMLGLAETAPRKVKRNA